MRDFLYRIPWGVRYTAAVLVVVAAVIAVVTAFEPPDVVCILIGVAGGFSASKLGHWFGDLGDEEES